jgi:transcriptional regulator with XRE-family HTH domain
MSETATVPEFTIGDRLRKARHCAHLTAEEMAAILEVSVRTVRNYEHDVTSIKRPALAAWAQATNVDAFWLATGKPSPPPSGRRRTSTGRVCGLRTGMTSTV